MQKDTRHPHEIEEEHLEDADSNLDRVKGFSDGVFAIAVTLLVLNLKIPVVPSKQADELLLQELVKQIPQFIGYIIAFLLTGLYWMIHHRLIRYIHRFDRRFLWQNTLILFFVSLLPFVAGLAGQYPMAKTSWVLYASYLALLGLVVSWTWSRSYKHRLTHHWVGPRLYAWFMARSLVVAIVATLAIPVAYINPLFTPYTFALTPLIMRLLKSRFHTSRLTLPQDSETK